MNLILGDSAEKLKEIPSSSVDLTVTSPPYDNLRDYNGYTFDFDTIANELYRVTKDGGVVVWIVADATIDGSETGTSFRQALYFKSIGFNIHDTMIWDKDAFTATGSLRCRYASVFEYMFVFSKGKIKTFNPIKDKPNKHGGEPNNGMIRQKDGRFRKKSNIGKPIELVGQRYNIWTLSPAGKNKTEHPAVFPFELARDHILSWSNKGDTVLDPFLGSGTTGLAALDTGRDFIGIEISEEYMRIAKDRIDEASAQIRMPI